jgi:hypothetical protein
MDGLDVGLGGRGLHECFRLLAVIDVRETSNGGCWKKEEYLRQGVSSFSSARLWRSRMISVDLGNEE